MQAQELLARFEQVNTTIRGALQELPDLSTRLDALVEQVGLRAGLGVLHVACVSVDGARVATVATSTAWCVHAA